MQPKTLTLLALLFAFGIATYFYFDRGSGLATANPSDRDDQAIAACKDEIGKTLRDRGSAEILAQSVTRNPQDQRSVSITMRMATADAGLQDVLYSCAVTGRSVQNFTQRPAQP